MEEVKALKIVSTLAEGIDPETGEIFPKDSPYQNAETVRALYAAVDALKAKIKKKNMPNRAGQRWEEDESNQLIEKYDSGMKIIEIAKKHKRTISAIRLQLVKLGKIEADERG